MIDNFFKLIWFGAGLYWGITMDNPKKAIIYFLMIAFLFFVIEPSVTMLVKKQKIKTTHFKALLRAFRR